MLDSARSGRPWLILRLTLMASVTVGLVAAPFLAASQPAQKVCRVGHVAAGGRIAILWNANDQGMTLRYREIEKAARTLHVEVQAHGVRDPDDFETAFSAMTRKRPDAIDVERREPGRPPGAAAYDVHPRCQPHDGGDAGIDHLAPAAASRQRSGPVGGTSGAGALVPQQSERDQAKPKARQPEHPPTMGPPDTHGSIRS
jgi:hypothetical protein